MSDPSIPEHVLAFALEDYRLWLRELEKQDRWFAQVVWVVMAGCGAASATLINLPEDYRLSGAIFITFAGLLFVSMNTEFLVRRVVSYRQVARRVATVRASLGMMQILKIPERYGYGGSPLLSGDPTAFVRTAYLGKSVGFRPLFRTHQAALMALYVLLWYTLSEKTVPQSVAGDVNVLRWIVIGGGLFHAIIFTCYFRWKVSEAITFGELIVTVARDYGVGVARDAEDRLRDWIVRRSDVQLLERARSAIGVIVSYEDKRFRLHLGVDPLAIVSVVTGRRGGGATTIPMQLARQLLPKPHGGPLLGTLARKIYECVMGSYLVLKHGRDRVLAMWLRTIPFGTSRILGIEAAAKEYFGKDVSELDALDGLLLGERITVYTGRFYPNRVRGLFVWATEKGLLRGFSEVELNRRLETMRSRVPEVGKGDGGARSERVLRS